MKLKFDLYAAGALAPGIGSLHDLIALRRSARVLESDSLTLPVPHALDANERRRASQAVRLSMACAEQALRTSPFAVDRLRLVFASDEGTGEVCKQMLEALATGRDVSPLVFHNSVHNAPSGYFTIGHHSKQPALSVSLGLESFASGLLCAATEAHTTRQPVLFVCYDPPMPPPMRSLLPVEQASATAWVMAASSGAPQAPAPLASFTLELGKADAEQLDTRPAWLPAAWAANASAAGMVALGLLADKTGACEMRLGYQKLRLERLPGAAVC